MKEHSQWNDELERFELASPIPRSHTDYTKELVNKAITGESLSSARIEEFIKLKYKTIGEKIKISVSENNITWIWESNTIDNQSRLSTTSFLFVGNQTWHEYHGYDYFATFKQIQLKSTIPYPEESRLPNEVILLDNRRNIYVKLLRTEAFFARDPLVLQFPKQWTRLARGALSVIKLSDPKAYPLVDYTKRKNSDLYFVGAENIALKDP